MIPPRCAAISECNHNLPAECRLDPKPDKPIYALVEIDQWPYAVHYEFRAQVGLLYVELHIEDGKYAQLGETFRRCAEELQNIQGYTLEYH